MTGVERQASSGRKNRAEDFELDETSELETGSTSTARSRRAWDSEDAILSLYVREMGANPLISERKEVELARQLQDAREALAKLALDLPAACRDYALEGDLAGPKRGREWPLDRVDNFYSRLLRYVPEEPDLRVANLIREAKKHKCRMDHAREALILANLRLVVYLAKKYRRHGVSFMDLIQEGNIGLIKAVEKFEVERGNKFSTCAYWWIKQEIQRAIADKSRLIRLPVHVNEKMKKIFRTVGEMGEPALVRREPQEIASVVGMPVEMVEAILRIGREPQAFEEFSAGEDTGLLDFLEDPDALSPIQAMLDRERREKIEWTLKALTPREEKILRMRFGIGRETSSTLEEIGRTLGLSRERVRQIEVEALEHLRKPTQAALLKDLLDGDSAERGRTSSPPIGRSPKVSRRRKSRRLRARKLLAETA